MAGWDLHPLEKRRLTTAHTQSRHSPTAPEARLHHQNQIRCPDPDMGNIQADLLHEWGLKDGHFVIDIGCGSGRLASALQKRGTEIQYLGTDIVPELLKYAKTKAPPHYRFQLSTEFRIPASDASADFVTFFSVFTHLYHEKSFAYLKDSFRVLRKGGR
jgi:ubiquinone/menaquinone biosynthesis C-methylase UbiE